MIAPQPTETLLQAVENIRPILEANSAKNDADRRLADATYDAMLDAGLFRMLVPRELGGMEIHPVEALKVYEAIAKIDSAAAWNLSMSIGIGAMAAWLSEEGAREIYSTPDAIAAGAFAPPAQAVAVEGGWQITGKAPYFSGCQRAQWFMFTAVIMEDGAPKVDEASGAPIVLVTFSPRERVEVHDTWNTLGMRGTFSSAVSVTETFVPAHRATIFQPLTNPCASFDSPLYNTWFWTPVHGESSVSLGVASAAIDKLLKLIESKSYAITTKTLRDREMVQHHVAKASALVDAARVFLHSALSQAFDEAVENGQMSEAAKIRCQLAACFTAESCADAVNIVHRVAGASGIRIGEGFERHFRDIHTLTQHASKSYIRYESAGKMMVGLPTDWMALQI